MSRAITVFVSFLTLLDADGNIVARHDTVRVFQLPRIPPPGAMVEMHIRTAVPPGRYDYLLRMEGGEQRVVPSSKEHPTTPPALSGSGALAHGRVVIPTFAPPELRVSSIALGRHSDARNAWRRADAALALMPTHVVASDRQVALYYEVYGARADRNYMTEITVQAGQDEEKRRDNSFTIRFNEDPAAINNGTLASRRMVNLADLGRGYYRLTINVTEAGGALRQASRTTVLIVR